MRQLAQQGVYPVESGPSTESGGETQQKGQQAEVGGVAEGQRSAVRRLRSGSGARLRDTWSRDRVILVTHSLTLPLRHFK